MKKCIMALLFLGSAFTTYAQSTAIPDSNFEQALIDLNIDSDGLNGSILNTDALQIISTLDVSHKSISDLSGIEAFQNMESLICSSNNLTVLDLSTNLSLTSVNANSNMLVSINLSNLQNLWGVQVQDNELTSLDLSSLPNLYFLYCFTNNISSLDFSNNYSLKLLSCGENQLTGSLDISNLLDLEFFACYSNQITHINMSIHPSIYTFNCRSNNVIDLDFSQCYSLENVYVDSNNLVSLNMSNGLNYLINDFHAEGNPNLYCINVDDSTLSTNSPIWNEDSQSYYSNNCSSLGIEENKSNEITVSPNPATDNVIIKMKNIVATYGEILSVNGKTVLRFDITSTTKHLNLNKLKPGIYFLKIANFESRLVKLE